MSKLTILTFRFPGGRTQLCILLQSNGLENRETDSSGAGNIAPFHELLVEEEIFPREFIRYV